MVLSTVVRNNFTIIIVGDIAKETVENGVIRLNIPTINVQATLSAGGWQFVKNGAPGTLRVDARRPVTKKVYNRNSQVHHNVGQKASGGNVKRVRTYRNCNGFLFV